VLLLMEMYGRRESGERKRESNLASDTLMGVGVHHYWVGGGQAGMTEGGRSFDWVRTGFG